MLPGHRDVAYPATIPWWHLGILAFLRFPRSMSVFSVVSSCAGIFGYLLDTVSELMYQCGPSAGEFTTSCQEMVLRLSRQPGDWQKRNVYPVRNRLWMKRRVACWSSSCSAFIVRFCSSCLSFSFIKSLPPCSFLVLCPSYFDE